MHYRKAEHQNINKNISESHMYDVHCLALVDLSFCLSAHRTSFYENKLQFTKS